MWTIGGDRLLDLAPVDPLDRIDRRAHVGAAFDQAQNLLRLEADIGVDEQQMRRGRIVEKLRDQARPRARDQRVAILELDLEIEVAVGAHDLLQPQQRGRIEHRNLPAETRRGDNQIDLRRRRRLQRHRCHPPPAKALRRIPISLTSPIPCPALVGLPAGLRRSARRFRFMVNGFHTFMDNGGLT